MPAPTVASSSVALIGPAAADGSFFARYSFVISDGTKQSFDTPHEPKGTDTAARLTELTAVVNAQLAIVPSPVTLAQAHQAIINAGLRSAVDAAVAAASADVQTLWYASPNVQRDDPNLIALGAGLGLTSDQIDDLFRAAAKL